MKGIAPREVVQDYIEGEVVTPDNSGKDKTLTEMVTGEKPAKVEVISQDEARDFGKAWKASGWTVAEGKTWLKDNIGVASSLDIPKDRYDEAMVWAKTLKPVLAEKSTEELKAADAFKMLDWNEKEQGRFVEQYKGDWAVILSELNILIDKRNAEDR